MSVCLSQSVCLSHSISVYVRPGDFSPRSVLILACSLAGIPRNVFRPHKFKNSASSARRKKKTGAFLNDRRNIENSHDNNNNNNNNALYIVNIQWSRMLAYNNKQKSSISWRMRASACVRERELDVSQQPIELVPKNSTWLIMHAIANQPLCFWSTIWHNGLLFTALYFNWHECMLLICL